METKLSNQTPPFLADFDVVICHAVFCSKRDCDCDWLTVSEGGSGSLASETGCLTSRSEFFSFALVGSLCSSTFFFASSPGACLQATSLNVSADDWKWERATTQALPFLSQTPLFAARFFDHPHQPRTWPDREHEPQHDSTILRWNVAWTGLAGPLIVQNNCYNSPTVHACLRLLNELDLPNSCYGYNSPPKSFEGSPVKSARKLIWIMRRILP